MDTCPCCAGSLGELDRCVTCGAAARVGAFEVRGLISQRAHSRLYRGVDGSGHDVALKELIFTLVPDRHTLEAFEREAEFLRRLAHPQIPRFVASLKVGEGVHTRLYLVQEYIPGPSLAKRFESERLDEAELVRIAAQVLTVLGYLHRQQPSVVHRDVKPANLIASPLGLRLVDFGTARPLSQTTTYRSTLVGTFGYMPLEQLGGTVDATSDLYALGATLLHGLTGRAPETMMRDPARIELPRSLPLSPARREWLARLLEPRRLKRFGSALEARRALLKPKRRLRPAPLAIAAAALMVLGGARFFGSRPSAATARAMRFEAYNEMLYIFQRQRSYYWSHDMYGANLPTVGVEAKDTCLLGSGLPPPRDLDELVTCHFRVRMERLGDFATGHLLITATGEAPPALGLTYTVTSDGVARNGIPTLDHLWLTDLIDWSTFNALVLTALNK